MAQYAYTAINKDGEKIKGQFEATGENELRILLRTQQLRPLKISKVTGAVYDPNSFRNMFAPRITDAELLLFTRQMAILLNSGIPLVQGLEIIGDQLKSTAMKDLVVTVREKVSGGSFLWESLKAYPDTFSSLYISMVKAGESSGALDTILKRLMRYLEDSIKLKKLVKGAMVYPVVVCVIGIAVVLIMLGYVIPKFEEMLATNGQELPELTQIVISASHFVTNYFVFIMAAIFLIAVTVKKYFASEEGKTFFDSVILRVPLFGPLVMKVSVARFCRTMQTMLSSGINLLDSLEICKGAVGNRTFSEQLTKVKVEVEGGKTIASVLAKNSLFPSMMVQMVTVGEATGNLDQMLERVADFYEDEVTGLVANLTKMVEPLILVFLGGTVAFLMVAMYLPIFKMAG